MMPLCDQTGVPGLVGLTHFHSSTTSGSASLMSQRILPRVSPRQSPSSAIRSEMSSDADWPWLALDFFMLSSSCVRSQDLASPTASQSIHEAPAAFATGARSGGQQDRRSD